MRRRTIAVALATVVTVLGLAAPAGAATTAPAPKGDGAKALCKRADRIDARIERAPKRLDGPVTRRGPIKRLQQRVAAAEAAGHTEIETYLNDRLTFRTSLVPTLQQRRTDLGKVQDWCADHHDGAAS